MTDYRLNRWMLTWLSVSSFELTSFCLFVFLRPLSMPGGSLNFLWPHYTKYMAVDHSIGDLSNAFIFGQAFMTSFEVLIALMALVFHLRGRNPQALLFAFLSCVLTGAKTMLIFVNEIASGLIHVGHNSVQDLALLYFLPNGLWIVFPLWIAFCIGKALVQTPMARVPGN